MKFGLKKKILIVTLNGTFVFFLSYFNYLFIYLFMAVLGLRFCARAFSSCSKRGRSSSQCAGLSLLRPLLLRSTGSRRAGSVIVAHGPSCSAACGIFPDQGWNLCPLHWQADSQPLRHQGSPGTFVFNAIFPTTTPTLGAVTIAFLSVLETGLLLSYSDTHYQICV